MIFRTILLLSFLFAFALPAISPVPAQAAAQVSQSAGASSDIMGQIGEIFQKKSQAWGDKLVVFAERLFAAMLLLDVLLFGIKEGINRAAGGSVNPGEVLGKFTAIVILPATFMYVILHNYQDWSQEIINGLKYVAGQVEQYSNIVDTSSFFIIGIKLFNATIEGISFSNPASWALLVAAFVLLGCFVLIAVQILMIKCEAYIVLSGGIIILGLGAFEQTRSYAVNFIRYVLSVAIKLYVMQLMIGLIFSFANDFTTMNAIKMTDIPIMIGGSVVMLALIRSIPDICSGIVHGQHVSSGNSLGGAMGAVAGAAAGAAAGMAGAAIGTGQVSAAVKAATQAGKGGSTLGNMARALGGAAMDAAIGNPERSFTGRLNSGVQKRAESARMENANGQDGGTA